MQDYTEYGLRSDNYLDRSDKYGVAFTSRDLQQVRDKKAQIKLQCYEAQVNAPPMTIVRRSVTIGDWRTLDDVSTS